SSGASVGASLLVLRDLEGASLLSSASLPVLRASRVRGKIRVDGNLDKAPWRAIEPVALAPSHGRDAPAGFQPTALRLGHDGERLYVAFAATDAHVWGTHRGRHEPVYEE